MIGAVLGRERIGAVLGRSTIGLRSFRSIGLRSSR
jgi:hypothetical protein